MNALAIDESIDTNNYEMPKGVDVLDLNNPDEVISWIFKNAKEV